MELRVRQSPRLTRVIRVEGRRRGQLGFTLPELLVALAILAIISGSLASAFEIGLRLLGPTGAQATLTGNHDLLSFEQQIGADVARADCLAAPGLTSVPTGGCASFLSSVQNCAQSQDKLCLAWYVPGSQCHAVTYLQRSDGTIVRSDNINSSSARIATGGLTIIPSWSPARTSSNSYSWTKWVTITVIQTGIARAPAAKVPVQTTFQLVPLAADPLSLALPAGTSRC
jgi:prepilin-type N-terminal cleavage/methylation domain-containing protein